MNIVIEEKKNISGDISNYKIEMLCEETSFLLDLLERCKPKKILEIGIAAGGTSSLILQRLSGNQKLFSVDYNKLYYRDNRFKTGYIVDMMCTLEQRNHHKVYLGEDVVSVIEDIGRDIDFCIIDTTHSLPGEVLSFLAVYPFLAENACVVLHDLTLNLNNNLNINNLSYRMNAFATKILFSTVVCRQKLLLGDPLSNIGAFFIDETTERNIENIFLSLSITWNYYPADILPNYIRFFEKYYSPFCLLSFLKYVKAHTNFIQKKNQLISSSRSHRI